MIIALTEGTSQRDRFALCAILKLSNRQVYFTMSNTLAWPLSSLE